MPATAPLSFLPGELQPFPPRPTHPDVLAGGGEFGQALHDSREDVTRYPTLIAVDQQVVASIEQRQIHDRPRLSVLICALVPVGRGPQLVSGEGEIGRASCREVG